MKKYLLIEDDKNYQIIFQDFLEDYNPDCKIDFIDNSHDAIDLLEKQNYDLIILDGMLSKGTKGEEVLNYIKEYNKELLSVVIFSSDETKINEDMSRMFGVKIIDKNMLTWNREFLNYME